MNLTIPDAELRNLIVEVVKATVAELDGRDGDGRLAYSAAEAGELLSVAGHVVRDMRLGGKLRGVKVGRCWKYPRRELERYLTDGDRDE